MSIITKSCFKLNWHSYKLCMRETNDMISFRVIEFLKLEAKESRTSPGTPEFQRSITAIINKLNQGKTVLTLLNNKPIIISKTDGKIVIADAVASKD